MVLSMRVMLPWFRLAVSAWWLGVEASSVVLARSAKIAAGGAKGKAEARRMVREKIDAGLELQRKALQGELGLTAQSVTAKTLAHYRRKVRTNQHRLANKSK